MKTITHLRSQQLDLLTNNCSLKDVELFYKEIVIKITKNEITKLDAYCLFTDLFEDCPESELKTFFPIFERLVENHIGLDPKNLHHCTKVIRTIMLRLTVTHDLDFRGTLQRFLTKVTPLTHGSGVNLRGALNETNTTSVETEKEVRDSSGFGLHSQNSNS